MTKRRQPQRTLTLGDLPSASPEEIAAAIESVPEEVMEGLARAVEKTYQIVRAVRSDPAAFARWNQIVADAKAFEKFGRLLDDPDVKASPTVERYFRKAIAEAGELPWGAELTWHLDQARARLVKKKNSEGRRRRARELFATGQFGSKRSNESTRADIAARLEAEGFRHVEPETVGRYLRKGASKK